MSCRKLVTFVTRRFSTTTRKQADIVHPGYKRLKAEQEIFQREDDLPVHVKKGGFDSMLYKVTLGLSVIGVAASCASIYRLAVGKKN